MKVPAICLLRPCLDVYFRFFSRQRSISFCLIELRCALCDGAPAIASGLLAKDAAVGATVPVATRQRRVIGICVTEA